MIVVYHKKNKVLEIDHEGKNVDFIETSIAETLFAIAVGYPEKLIVWCSIDFKSNLNYSKIQDIFHHKKILATYNLSQKAFLPEAIGYVEDSPFIKVNKKVSYPTWQMSGDVGGVHASVLLALKEEVNKTKNFDYFLNSLAKLAMPNGLLCYSEPKLLIDTSTKIDKDKSNGLYVLFQFVKQHYKTRWVFLLFLNLFLYERKLAVLPLFYSFFYRKRKINKDVLEKIAVQSSKKVVDKETIDVIIPTIGRKRYLYDVLKDLANQTHLPQNVIIVEQNPQEGSVSELDYLDGEKWPFIIKHIFTHQAGACNARNLALAEVSSEWVFLNDDDNRFENFLIKDVLKKANKYGTKALTISYLQPDEIKNYNLSHQTSIFGSGNSFVKVEALHNVRFDMALEFGYGEDTDFGIQLRNKGVDVIYFPDLKITHLKAPMGGFRIKIKKQWENDEIQPKPSPTIMYLKHKHFSKEQINGYKTVLFFKLFRNEKFITLSQFLLQFKKKWDASLYWSNQLGKND